jgi:hypothetical protein
MSDRMTRFDSLAEAAWSQYDGCGDAAFVVRPAIPILFFGDSAQYFRSARRIITVGLNPSQREFPAEMGWRRFSAARELYLSGQWRGRTDAYRAALDAYFRCDPYTTWFRCFEPILNGLAASYYGGYAHTALNTDLCSPLATAPTWSGLSSTQQARLMQAGVTLWHRLVEYLEPDLIVISVARQLLGLLQFEQAEPWRPIYTIDWRKDGSLKRRPYAVEAATIRLGGGKLTRIVFGRAAHTPFGLISNADKLAIGALIGAELERMSSVQIK